MNFIYSAAFCFWCVIKLLPHKFKQFVPTLAPVLSESFSQDFSATLICRLLTLADHILRDCLPVATAKLPQPLTKPLILLHGPKRLPRCKLEHFGISLRWIRSDVFEKVGCVGYHLFTVPSLHEFSDAVPVLAELPQPILKF